ncbi:hypothetical protein Ppa06_63230 [Planomonospora parontospora subsp. parontospora]|uniref:Replication initiation protein n=2 Tax=Planomonospora parontospora TaxID=58119 RepID=A0AA37F835_9ACTN|nr:replication initiator [Planomonospora parontospora]GGK94892.1 hypothetical protein GCM10010126_62910 [Planomonospora parontospora]GII12525.1 hypothetical protein Ppa06_63230 [Planomonospora parontospora subsp. parontospora]
MLWGEALSYSVFTRTRWASDERIRRMIYTCSSLGDLPGYRSVPLRKWAHTLGYGGHFSTKSRRYSVTLGDLRRVRADHRAAEARQALGLPDPAEGAELVMIGQWSYAGGGHRDGEASLAELSRQRLTIARMIRKERESGSLG